MTQDKNNRSMFPPYFVGQTLREAGWPKTQGRFRKRQMVSRPLFISLVGVLNRIAIGLGAGRPEIALKLLGESYGNSVWNDVVDVWIEGFHNEVEDKLGEDPSLAPWEAFNPWHGEFAKITDIEMAESDLIEWKSLGEPELEALYTIGFTRSLMWGLSHSDEAEAQLRDSMQSDLEVRDRHPTLIMTSDPPADLDELYEQFEAGVTAFETERRPLSAVPSMLRYSVLGISRLGDDAT